MKRLLRISILSAITLVGLAALTTWLSLRASLPRRSATAPIPQLSASVELEFDNRGIVRIRADNQLDALAAQGFVHAQDRFFQMDLARRSAAGELAALFGRAALNFDIERRAQQLRRRARALLARLPTRHSEQLASYTRGVNAGLEDLGAWPPEYLLLRQRPQVWKTEDSMLVVYALYTMLSNNDSYERHNGALRDLLPQALFEFLTPLTARDDRPLMARDDTDRSGGYEPVPIPPAELVDLRTTEYAEQSDIVRQPLAPNGSNSWAVVGGTLGPQALLANDPHLGIRVPNFFHRAELYWGNRTLRGVGIPGLPGIMLGANNNVAWGATVSYADQADFVVIEPDVTNPDRYLIPTGAENYTLERELIEVAGQAEAFESEIRLTRWGPIVGQDHSGRPLALRASWLESDGLDLSLLDIADAQDIEDAITLLRDWRGPSLSWVAADTHSNVGWTMNGPLPVRRNFTGSVPEFWGSGDFGWRGEADLPYLAVHGTGSVYSANNRQLAMPWASELRRLSLPPHRARTIAEAIEAESITDEAASLALQLDTRVAAFDQLRDTILESVSPEETEAELARARTLIETWDGHAQTESLAMPILERYYDALLESLLGPLLIDIRRVDPDFVYRWPLVDEVMRRVLDERPPHFLPSGYSQWNDWLREILRRSLIDYDEQDWGNSNRLDVAHPLASVPGIGGMFDWPQPALPGNTFSLRVAHSDFGAVIRMNVRPSSQETGILQLAGGQSGHFLSPHYDDQLTDWVQGRPAPFLAGPAQHSFVLHPESE